MTNGKTTKQFYKYKHAHFYLLLFENSLYFYDYR